MKTALKFALAGASALALAAPGYAQSGDEVVGAGAATGDEVYEANNDDAIARSTIIVEGRRRLESEQDVPQTINVVTQEDLQKLNLRDGSDLASVVPGLNLDTNYNGIGGNASIRGVNFEINASGNNPTVEFYQNDAPVTAQVFLQANYDIGQIETLRGPQGTLRGRASPSGAITIRTRRPDLYDFGGYIDATGNDIGGMNVNGAVGIPIVEGVLGVRLAGLYAEDEANRVNTVFSGPGVDRRDPLSRTRSGRASVLFTPTDWFELFGSYQHIDRDARNYQQVACNPFGEKVVATAGTGAVGTPAAQNAFSPGDCSPNIRGKDRLAIGDLPLLTSTKFDLYNANAKFTFGGQNLIYTGSYTKQQTSSRDPNDGADMFPGVEVSMITDTVAKNESHELRLQNDERLFNGLLDYVVGGFIYTTDSPSALINELTPAGPGGQLFAAINRSGTTKEKSIFGNLTAHPTDRLELSVGARYIDYKSDSNLVVDTLFGQPDGASGPVGPQQVAPFNVEESRTIYTASASYDITDDLMAYASFGSSYRPPIFAVGCFNSNCNQPDVFAFQGITKGETSESYEIGIKSSLFDGRMRLNVSAYKQDFENLPYRAPGAGVFYGATAGGVTVPGPATTVAQFNFIAGVPAEVKGLEAEIAYEFSDNFNLGATLAYADGQIKGGNIPCNDFDNGGAGDGNPDDTLIVPDATNFGTGEFIRTCKVDQRSSFAAPFQASVFGEFTAPLNQDIGFFLRGLYDFSGNSKNDPNNSIDDIDEYGILNLYTGIRDPDGKWELTAFGKNLFNTYRTLSRDLTPASTAPPGSAPQYSNYSYITSTAPQEFGVNLRYRFGSDNQ